MKAAGYIRVSSRAQDYATQRHALEQAARGRGHEIVRWFEETRSGGRNAPRPQLDALLEAIHRGEFAIVYVFRLDRLTRRGMRDTLAVVDRMHQRGCALISAGEAWFDLRGPWGELILAVIGWAAQQELAALGERIAAARTRVEAEGKHWGRPRACNLELVARIDAMASAGKSQRKIAVALKIKRPTVAAVLARKGAYAGLPPRSQKRPNGAADPGPAK